MEPSERSSKKCTWNLVKKAGKMHVEPSERNSKRYTWHLVDEATKKFSWSLVKKAEKVHVEIFRFSFPLCISKDSSWLLLQLQIVNTADDYGSGSMNYN